MRSETLQSLSVGMMFVGLFLAVLGGFGVFHFGHQHEQEQEKQRIAAVQSLEETVGSLREDQRTLRQQLTAMEKTETPPAIAEGPPPGPLSPDVSTAPLVGLSSVPAPAIPNLLLPHPRVPEEPAGTEAQLPLTVVKPPRLPLVQQAEPSSPAIGTKDDRLMGREKRDRLVRFLRTNSSQDLTIRVAADNARAMKLAGALRQVFREAGWSVGELEVTTQDLPMGTLVLSTGAFPPTREFVAAYGALAAAGFSVSNNLSSDLGAHGIALTVGPVP